MTSLSSLPRPAQKSVEQDDEIDLGQLVGTLWRGKLRIILAGLVTLCIGVWYAFFAATPVYTASAVVALESREQQVMDIESVVTGLSGDQATVNTEVEVIRSRELIERVVLDLDLASDPEFNAELREEPFISSGQIVRFITNTFSGAERQQTPLSDQATLDSVVDAVLERLSVSNIRQSYVFLIRITTEDPEKSAQIADRLAQLYISDQIRVKLEKTEQATTWLGERVAELQIELEQAEQALKSFSTNTDLVSPEGLVALNRQLKELRERRGMLQEQNIALRDRQLALQEARVTQSPEQIAVLAQDDILTAILERLSVDDTISARTFDNRLDVITAQTTDELGRKERQIAALEVSITEVTERIDRQSDELVQLQQFQREAEASRLIYEAFLARLKETSIQQGIQQADSRILSEAVVPAEPSAPRKASVLALSTLLGLIAGAAFVLYRELSQNTFRLAEDLEARTGYSVLGQIPAIPIRKRSGMLKYIIEKPNSAASEAVRNLRTSILLANLDRQPQIIMTTSSVPGEGKTTLSISLAQNFASMGEKVLLIEGDIRRRVFREYFDIKSTNGLLSVLSGEATLDSAVVHDQQLQADILVGEKSNVNAADLFSSKRFSAFLKELRGKYDRIIIDTPPVLAVPDARVMGQSVDTIIYAVKWDSTTHRQVHEGIKSLEAVNLRIAGLTLGQIDKRGMRKYGYGADYGNYEGYYEN
ncbi:MAG: polysaccharide biosynthesis tyrosine autokinase [Pseudomonadota bacterium]